MRFSFFDRANNPESRTSDPCPSGGTVEDLSDATLRILSLSAGTLDPVFLSAHTSYTASVGNEVSPITVTAVPNAAGASVTYLDGSDRTLTDFDPGSANTFEVDLSAGANVIKVMVTAEDEITTKTYAVTVTVTATNGDGIAATWMARFGRTVADQVLDAVDDRMSAPRTPGTEISLAGHRTGSVDSHGGRSGRADGIAGTAHAGTRGKTEGNWKEGQKKTWRLA